MASQKAQLQVTMPADMLESMRAYVRTTPDMNLSRLAEQALKAWLVEIERQAWSGRLSDGTAVTKPPETPWPSRPKGARFQGRPMKGEARTGADTGLDWTGASFYVPSELAERVKNAAYWRRRYPAWDVTEAIARAIGYSPGD